MNRQRSKSGRFKTRTACTRWVLGSRAGTLTGCTYDSGFPLPAPLPLGSAGLSGLLALLCTILDQRPSIPCISSWITRSTWTTISRVCWAATRFSRPFSAASHALPASSTAPLPAATFFSSLSSSPIWAARRPLARADSSPCRSTPSTAPAARERSNQRAQVVEIER